MAKIRKNKEQIEDDCLKIHQHRLEGKTDREIRDIMRISRRDWQDHYLTRLHTMWRETWLRKNMDELYTIAQLTIDQMEDAYHNARRKAREDGADPKWGELEGKYLIYLNRFKQEGIKGVDANRARRLVQDISKSDSLSIRSPDQLRTDDGNDNSGTE